MTSISTKYIERCTKCGGIEVRTEFMLLRYTNPNKIFLISRCLHVNCGLEKIEEFIKNIG